MLSALAAAPDSLRGARAVWRRNAAVWLKSWKTSLVGSIGEPILYVLGLGWGLGTLVPQVGGIPYLHFAAPGLMLSSVMQSATIEATYGTFTKMEHQRVYATMSLAPLTFTDIVLGEILWAVTKGLVSGGAVLALILALGIGGARPAILGIPLLLLAGVIFASLGMVATALARGYDAFNYYFTLVVAPMFLFSGIFFPVDRLGPWAGRVAGISPLTHLVALSRAAFAGRFDAAVLASAAGLALFAAVVLTGALILMRRRFMP